MIAIEVRDPSHVAEARRIASSIAAASGSGPISTGRVAIVATELATNLLKHGGGGEMLLSSYEQRGAGGVQLIALDKGPGMRDLQACLQDGYSTAGSAGHGLGAVHRQSELFEVVSWPGLGTAVLSRVSAAETFTASSASTDGWGFVNIPKPGEDVSGDAFSVAHTASGRTIMVADGLGHGQEAAAAALEAVRLFQSNAARPLTDVLQFMHAGLRATRGAAAAIVRFDPQHPRVDYAGIGNIAGIVVAAGQTRHMISLNGTLGHNARKVQSFEYPAPAGSRVIMHSDGLATSWSVEKYPGLMQQHPTLIAAVLYRDYARRRDDVTVLVATKA